MSTPSPTPATKFELYVKPWLKPYYLLVATVLGAITAVFGALTVALILIVTNFNILGWIE